MSALSPEEHRDAAAMLLAQVTWWSDPGDARIDPGGLPYLAAAQVHATLAGVTPSPQLPSVDITESVTTVDAAGCMVAVDSGPGLTVALRFGDPDLPDRYSFDHPVQLRRLAAALLGHADRIERGTT